MMGQIPMKTDSIDYVCTNYFLSQFILHCSYCCTVLQSCLYISDIYVMMPIQ